MSYNLTPKQEGKFNYVENGKVERPIIILHGLNGRVISNFEGDA